MFTGIDHLVILVRNLDEAMQTYQELGFQVARGGEHPGGTHNALIAFEDGAYIELIAFQEPDKPHDHRWYRFLASGGGLVDYALGANDVPDMINGVRERGLHYNGPVPGARKRPDGQEIAWRLAQPEPERTGELPFVIEDVSPRELRVASGEAARQPNGVTGIQSLVVGVADLDEAIKLYEKLLGVDLPEPVENQELGAHTVNFQVGPHEVILAQPAIKGSVLADHIERRGSGPFRFTLTVPGLDEPRHIDPATAEGARIVLA